MDEHDDIEIRDAGEADAAGVADVFRQTYGSTYSYPEFYDTDFLRRLILGDDALMFVAVDRATSSIIGTASVILQIGALSDLVGEFGRLAVVPDARRHHIGTMLMERRLEAVQDRLHLAIIDARVAHPYSVRIARRHGFAVVGFMPLRHMFDERESTCMLARWFGDSLHLRRNNPRITPEVQAVASVAMDNAGLRVDPIIDDDAPPYPHEGGYDIEEMTTDGYSTLLRIERGRVRHREVFGPMRLQYGFFKLHRNHAEYLIAREGRRIAGAIGFIRDDRDKLVRIFELIAPDDRAIHFLLHALLLRCRESWGIAYIEIDVRANSPRLQRTLIELGFTPAAYIPAMVFHEVERFDVVRMVSLLIPPGIGHCELEGDAREMCDVVLAPMERSHVAPRIREAVDRVHLLNRLTAEQAELFAGSCALRIYEAGETIFCQGEPGTSVLILLAGVVGIHVTGQADAVGHVSAGETLGEMGMLHDARHSATAVALDHVEAAEIGYETLKGLVRRRPDIGLVLYRNLASGLAEKLKRTVG